MSNQFAPSDAAVKASDYFNTLPREQRAGLAPLLEHYRQMGIAEARRDLQRVLTGLDCRVREIRALHEETSGVL
jgi:hypothetical protein